ncbi:MULTISPECIES: DUF4811 domain-containing protein [Fructobacillus]|jgi:hypothetical protein|uniref:DUF4811 domain-containing protein n=1 Tax=Fructobacillus cardui TaxID=2893170 RepID=A0ABN9YYP2_9LACO|nr:MULTISPECIES: DUF4811 domain-containing protein [Fructobacillus]KMK53689.1 hypothetical protein FEFB_04670 [Fructobacillus sp. EFB-N1]MCK8628083.1 DUF4811 domain-containing protein [Fructobacillus cardui]CAK1245129.1 hypothetical protein R82265_HNDDMDAM_00974 [Fructobacillus cardui]CAK1250411.1 hypothetical protein R82641_BJNNKPBH_01217 [Fructobacillus cardui]
MILVIIPIFVALAAASWFLISSKALKATFGTIFSLAMIASIFLLAANMDSHYGMKKETTVATKQVYSAAPAQMPVGMAAAKKIGTDDYVLVYKDQATDKEATAHFAPDTSDIVKSVKQSATYTKADVQTAQVKTVTTKWVYKNHTYKWLFKQNKEDNLVKEVHTLEVPTSWQVVLK